MEEDVTVGRMLLSGALLFAGFAVAVAVAETVRTLLAVAPPAPDPYDVGDQVWQVLEEVRRITEEAAREN